MTKEEIEMTMMVGSFAAMLRDMLTEMAKEEVGMLLGVTSEIKKLEVTLGDLTNVLADAERRRIADKAVQQWLRELKDVMYDADDTLDLCRIKADERRERLAACWRPFSKTCGIPLLSCLRNPMFAHKIGSQIKELNQRLQSLAQRKSNFDFNLSSNDDRRVLSHHVSRQKSPVIVHNHIVGDKIKKDTESLVAMLTKNQDNRHDNIMVVAIVGVGGIGKTTLAKMIYNDQKVQDAFEKRVWVCISQDFDEVKLLQNVIAGVTEDDQVQVQAQDKARLAPKLQHTVTGKKLLLVMDDMWSNEAWCEVLRDPLQASARDCRILVTTRNENVARRMNAVHRHRVQKLHPKDGWLLLSKEANLIEDEIESLMDIGMQIVGQCDGMPLAIKVIGGLLRTYNRTKSDWERVLKSSIWSMDALDDEVWKALYLSYEDLPSHLKQCFAYCSFFPEDATIFSPHVVSMWINEGFVQNHEASTLLEDIGEGYYRELITRNLLEPDDKYYDQMGCKMHDLVRSLGLFLVKDECLVLDEKHKFNIANVPAKLRRLSITSKEVELNSVLKKQESLRTLMLFGGPVVELDNFSSHMPCLRLLYLGGANLTTVPDSLCRLKHLKYLELSETMISRLPPDIENLKYLQYLNLQDCKNLINLPDGVVKLHKLRYLNICGTEVEGFPRGLQNLQNLVHLLGYRMHKESAAKHWSSLEELGPLSQLRYLWIQRLEEVTTSSIAAGAKLHSKHHLRVLSLFCTVRNGDGDRQLVEQRKIEEVFDELFPPSCVEVLIIGGYFGRRLPRWISMMQTTISQLENLRRLDLNGLTCCVQLPSGLAQLPNLDYLSIKNAPLIQCIGHEFIRSVGRNTAFPKLKKLFLEEMKEWEEWDWDENVRAMPNLSALSIRNCKLRCLPRGLAHQATALTSLGIISAQNIMAIDNFHRLNKLALFSNPNLERIAYLPNLQELSIIECPNLKILENVTALSFIGCTDVRAQTLPNYLQDVNLKRLIIRCSLDLLKLISSRDAGSEWEKIEHIQQVNAYADEEVDGEEKRWYVKYTKEPYNFTTNISNVETFSETSFGTNKSAKA